MIGSMPRSGSGTPERGLTCAASPFPRPRLRHRDQPYRPLAGRRRRSLYQALGGRNGSRGPLHHGHPGRPEWVQPAQQCERSLFLPGRVAHRLGKPASPGRRPGLSACPLEAGHLRVGPGHGPRGSDHRRQFPHQPEPGDQSFRRSDGLRPRQLQRRFACNDRGSASAGIPGA